MTASSQDVQALIDAAVLELKSTTSGGRSMVTQYGNDPTRWPTSSHWYRALADLAVARAEVGQLAAPPPPTSGDFFTRAATYSPPPMTVKRTLPAVKTYTDFKTAFGALQPGDLLPCQGVVFPAEATFSKRMSDYAKVTFDASCKFAGGAGARLPAIWMKDVAYLQFVWDPATLITNPADGGGIRYSGADHCSFDGFRVTHVAEDGMSGFPTVNHIQNCFFRGEVYDFCKVPSLDPHTEKGTGLHGFNTSDADVDGYLFRDNLVILYVHNDDTAYGGSAVEHGNPQASYAPAGNRFLVKAHGLRQNATSQVAGNGINLWGYIHDVELVYVEVDDMAGRAVEAAPYGSWTNVKVTAGTATNYCLNPLLAGQTPWSKKGGVQYGTVTPAA